MSKWLRDPRLIAVVLLAIGLAVAAVFVPHPSVDQIRHWADSVGPMFPLVFFLVHAIVTVAPIPRTAFTLSAGLLFGPLTGIVIAVSATTVSALLALLLVRAIGREAFATRMTHRGVKSIDRRLARRGWLAVGSLRLIAPVPFSLINYCCGVSSVRLLPYLLATLVGVIPGTIGVVVLGDALTGRTNPGLLLLSGVCIAIGVIGLMVDARMTVDAQAEPSESDHLVNP